MKTTLTSLALLLLVTSARAQLFINEFVASNDHTIHDEMGDYDDWIELYNASDSPINLSGYSMTDEFSEPTKWLFPDVNISPRGYLIVWADEELDQGDLHADFKIGAGGEELAIFYNGNFIDSLTFGEQSTDVSYGRLTDGGSVWAYFNNPSPGGPNTAQSVDAELPVFSVPGGYYSAPFSIELSDTSPTAEIYFTNDGSDPTESSSLYTDPIMIDGTTVIRARSYDSEKEPSPIVTQSYILNTQYHLGVLSLTSDPYNLWDNDYGIYVNYDIPDSVKDEWERPAFVEYYNTNGDLEFAYDVGIRIHGGYSRGIPKKSFRIYFRSEYGTSWLNYQLYQDKDIDEYKRIVVKGGANDCVADDREYFSSVWSLIRDMLMQDLNHSIGGMGVASQPVILYLNGQPWGIYICTERIDEYYIEKNFGLDDVDLIKENSEVVVGTNEQWNNLNNFLENNNLSNGSNFDQAADMIDIRNITDYNIVQIFGGNKDWPNGNIYCFRPHDGSEPWRWIMWDADYTLGSPTLESFDYNTLWWATWEDLDGTLPLRSLLRNESYQKYFINRFADLLNTLFVPENINRKIDSLAALIAHEIPVETARWGGSFEQWEPNINRIKDYVNQRPDNVRDHIKSKFLLNGYDSLNLSAPQPGLESIRVNSIEIKQFPWSGIYFEDVPIEIEAKAAIGYNFKEWSNPELPDTNLITLPIDQTYNLYPIFESDNQEYNVVINEINYNSASDFDPDDWIELHNISDNAIDISGWHYKDSDDNHDFEIPANTSIAAHGYLVLCNNSADFQNLFPEVANYIGDVDFGLSSSGELVRLYDSRNRIVDSLTFDDKSPWPTAPDGDGPTLELIQPELDNALPESWQASAGHGTPGQANTIFSGEFVISGKIVYSGNGQPVPETTLQLNGTASTSHKSDENGAFEFSGLITGDYSLESSKQLEIENPSIMMYDASLAAQIALSLIEPTAHQSVAADVDGDTKILTYDAHLIACYAVGLPSVGTSYVGEWRFQPDARNYQQLSEDQIDQDFTAYLLGDVDNSWSTDESLAMQSAPGGEYHISEALHVTAGELISIPINAHTGENIYSCDVFLTYDPQALEFVNLETTALSNNFFTVVNSNKIGKLRFGCYGTQPILQPGPYLKIIFKAIGDGGASAEFNLESYRINNNPASHGHLSIFIGNDETNTPHSYRLYQNYPNPFNPATRINYDVPYAGKVNLSIFTINGEFVRTLVDAAFQSGQHHVQWDGENDKGIQVASGIYLCRMKADNFVSYRKMIYIR
ncbi:CotH kinase family protein [candidate division KSB1 bacterium]|nr:CotH kinase family protein [candidate division KSB1 bacterium]